VGTLLSPGAMLPLLAGLHAACALLSYRISDSGSAVRRARREPDSGLWSGLTVLRRSGYLRTLGLLVLLGTLAASLIDFAFKAHATQTFDDPGALVRFFAVFYAATALLAFLVQTFLVSSLLKTPQDLSRNVSLLPLVVALGALLAILIPGLVVVTVARAFESIVRNSAFRSSYEIFFNPVAAADKRSSKTIIDVGFDRLGDLLGGLLIQAVILVTGVASGLPFLLVAAVLAALFAVWHIRHLQGGYVQALEGIIREQVTPVPRDEHRQATIDLFRSQVTRLHPTLHPVEFPQNDDVTPAGPGDAATVFNTSSADTTNAVTGTDTANVMPGQDGPDDPDVQRMRALESRDPQSVRSALEAAEPLRPDMIAVVISLLAWDAIHPLAARALQRNLERSLSPLVDAMLARDSDFAIRRRIPPILAALPSADVVGALLQALSDERFEVRYQAALALARMKGRNPDVQVDRQVVLDIITREAQVDQRMWNRRRLLDAVESESTPFYRDVLRNRTHRSLEHLFHLLSLAFPADPLRVAYDGLHTGDPVLRGTALEYLESILPREVRQSLWPLLGSQPQQPVERKTEKELLDSLLQSHESILIQLKNLEKRSPPDKHQR
jgi:hypothetical protein